MPCQGGMSYREVVVESGEVIDDLTQKLCYVCAALYADGLLEKYANQAIIAWHQKHMHTDEVRVATKMQALFRKQPNRMADTDAVAEQFLQAALKVHPVSEYHRNWFKQMAKEAADAIQAANQQAAEAQQAKARALGKLSDEDKRALGLSR